MAFLAPAGALLAAAAGCGGSVTSAPGATTSGTSAAGAGGATASSASGPTGAGGAISASSSGATTSSTAGAAGAGGAACVPVDDHDPCTDDRCQGGVPVHVPETGTPCPSSDPCVVGKTCQAGVCGGGAPLACSGGSTCQAGGCVAPACTGALGLPGPPELSQHVAVAAADFDGDGKEDLAVADGDTDSVTVLFGLGNGAFAAPVRFPAGLAPSNVAAADLNGDGRPDLVVANGVGGTVNVLLNLGGGAFAPAVAYAAVKAPGAIAVVDLDGDGNADIAVADEGGSTVGVLLGQGGGAFAPAIGVNAGANLVAIAAADFDGDGKPDLAVATSLDWFVGGVSVLWNQGGGAFSAPAPVGAAAGSIAMQVADFDGDGKPDLAVAVNDADVGTGSIIVFLNQGQRVFSSAGGYDGNGFEIIQALATADFDDDGKPDLATAQLGNTVSVLLNQGGGAFALASTTSVGARAVSMAAADLDGDGKLDLAVAVAYDTLDVLSNQGGGALAAAVAHYANTVPPVPMYPVGMTPEAIAAADFDGDGRPDLAVIEYDSQEVGILHNQGDGTFVVAAQIALPTALMDLAAADVDGDGAPDLLVALLGNGTLSAGGVAVLLNHGDGTFAPPVQVPAGPHPSALVVADLNGDGMPDLAVLEQSANLLTVILNKGDGTFSSAVDIQTGSMPLAITSADFNHDGLGDLAITVGPFVNILLNQGGGSFGPVVSYATDPAMSGAESIAAADFDEDGWADLAVGNVGGTLAILRNQHDGTFAVSYATGSGAPAVAVDLNGDGAPDLVFPGNGATVVMNQGGGTFATPVSYGAGDGPAAVAAADFNGDGRPDLAVADFNGNTVSVLFNVCLP